MRLRHHAALEYRHALFPQLLDWDRFNARRRDLIAVLEAIQRALRDQKLNQADPIRLVDSAPITWMTYPRGSRCTSVVGSEYFGVVTSKQGKVLPMSPLPRSGVGRQAQRAHHGLQPATPAGSESGKLSPRAMARRRSRGR